MTSELERLEAALGVKIERKDSRVVPGTVPVNGREIVYFSGNIDLPRRVQFQRLTTRVQPPLLGNGGASEKGCTIYLPDGTPFHAMSYHGDIEGWRKQIGQGASELNFLIATIADDELVISDGPTVALAKCTIEFD